MAITVGSLLAGRYEITAPVAVGGMGEVWQARDQVLDRTVAAKVLRSEYTGDPNFLARFRNEARHTAALSHPNIASIYDYGETPDAVTGQQLAFLVMEYVEGQPLVTILHEEGRLPVDWTLSVVGQAAEGLSAAHRAGVVHRDIKPGNLMVRPDGVVKLTDFGIAQARDATPLTRTGMVVGTAQYLSPEQAQGFAVTAASDVYSLGVVAYECLAGVRPFDGTSQVAVALAHINRPPPPLPGDVPLEVRGLIGRALAKDPGDRFPDGGAFADAIRRVAAGQPLDGPGGGGPRTGGLAAGGALAGGALAAGAFGTGALAGAGSAVPTGATQVIGDPATGTRVFDNPTAPGYAAAAGGPGTAARPMPPLHGPPVDDELPGDEYPEDRPGSRRWIWLAAAVVALLLIGGGAWLLLTSGHDNGPTAQHTGSASAPSSVASALVDTAAYVGKPADVALTDLRNKGFTQVSQRPASSGQMQDAGVRLAAGDVVTTDPANQTVPTDTPVVVYVAPRDYAPGGTTTSAAPTTTSPAPTTTAPRTTTAPPTTATTTVTVPPSPLSGTSLPPTVSPSPSADAAGGSP